MSEIIHEYLILTSCAFYFAQYNIDMENILRQKRKQLGLTQEQAAKACGVSRRTYQTYEETGRVNATYDDIYVKLDQLREEKKFVHSISSIKKICRPLFKNVPEVECAYLFGSYARGETTFESDIDILIVGQLKGLRYTSMLSDLDSVLGKEINLITHRKLIGDDISLLESVLKDGIKIYRKKN